MNVTLISITGNAEDVIEFAGRVCYRTGDSEVGSGLKRGRERFIRARIQQGHLSLLEHASATFLIEGISRACSHQLVRHRLASYSQESQRYVPQGDEDAVMPPSVAQNRDARTEFSFAMTVMREAYEKLLELGIPKEDARFILPNAMATRLVFTANFRELLHIFSLRITKEAQWEIRELCARMLAILWFRVPSVFQDEEVRVADNMPDLWTKVVEEWS